MLAYARAAESRAQHELSGSTSCYDLILHCLRVKSNVLLTTYFYILKRIFVEVLSKNFELEIAKKKF